MRKCHIHTLQTKPRHIKEYSYNTKSHMPHKTATLGYNEGSCKYFLALLDTIYIIQVVGFSLNIFYLINSLLCTNMNIHTYIFNVLQRLWTGVWKRVLTTHSDPFPMNMQFWTCFNMLVYVFNPYKPSVRFIWHWQTLQTQIRHRLFHGHNWFPSYFG